MNNDLTVYPMEVEDASIEILCFNAESKILQPKLNGIHATWHPATQTLNTRNGREITSTPHIVAALKACPLSGYPLDGEIYTQQLHFQDINALVRRGEPTGESYLLEFHCFDIAIDSTSQKDRLTMLARMGDFKAIKIVPSQTVLSRQQVRVLYKSYLKAGCEGVVIRDPDAGYKFGGKDIRAVRIIPVSSLEAQLTGFKPARPTSKNRLTFGSLILQLPNGRTFTCAGMKDKDRRRLWSKKPIGQQITVNYKSLSKAGVPVSPRYKDIRWDI